MLTLTEKAEEVVTRIGNNPRTSEAAGIRISRGGDVTNPMGVALADGPAEGDRILECEGGRVYVGRHAVDSLTGTTLDARTDQTGRVQFCIARPAA